ncbi:MAG: hypothetical protein NE330_03655, partial [Lentisphaeraceae bacterium]|nr:hypothetical protein [Lentisphaeraceae bacterium]
GGQIFLIPNENTDLDKLNDNIHAWLKSVIYAHKSVNGFSQTKSNALSKSTLKLATDLPLEEHYSIEINGKHHTLWKYTNGLTGFANIPIKKGDVTFIGFCGTLGHNSFLHSPAFILFWQDTLKYLQRTTSESIASTFMQPAEILLPTSKGKDVLSVTTPLGLVDKLAQTSNRLKVAYKSANIPGIYKTNLPTLPEFAVNSQRHNSFIRYPKDAVVFKQKAVSKKKSPKKLSYLSSDNILRMLIIFIILLIILELSIANRRSHANA